MTLVTDEQTIKAPSEFLKLDKENSVLLLSNVYMTKSHYLQDKKKSVACHGLKEGCHYCKKTPPRHEYYYFAMVNGEKGILRIPGGVFFSMNQLEKVMKGGKNKRDYSWIILKEGEGLETKYTCSKDEPIPEGEVKPEEIEKNNETLSTKIREYEARLEKNHQLFLADTTPTGEPDGSEDVNPSDIPF